MLRQAQRGRFREAGWAIVLLALLLLAAPVAAEPTFPKLTGRVVDAADILPPAEKQAIDAKLAALEAQSQRQLVVATLPDLQGYEISDYGYQLGRAWGLGDKERNDGALLIVAPNERKVRIEVGYGLEGILTDALSSLIINNDIVPRFRANDYPGGIAAGVDRLVAQLQLPEDEARRIAEAAQARQLAAPAAGAPELDFATIMFLVLIFLFVGLPILRSLFGGGRRHRQRGSGLGSIILWSALNSMSQGGRGGGFGGGFGSGGGFGGGGGGFSGGGGSFGGGGASGSW